MWLDSLGKGQPRHCDCLEMFGDGFSFSVVKKQSHSYLSSSCRLMELMELRKGGGRRDMCISELLQFQGYGVFGSYTAHWEIPVFT